MCYSISFFLSSYSKIHKDIKLPYDAMPAATSIMSTSDMHQHSRRNKKTTTVTTFLA